MVRLWLFGWMVGKRKPNGTNNNILRMTSSSALECCSTMSMKGLRFMVR